MTRKPRKPASIKTEALTRELTEAFTEALTEAISRAITGISNRIERLEEEKMVAEAKRPYTPSKISFREKTINEAVGGIAMGRDAIEMLSLAFESIVGPEAIEDIGHDGSVDYIEGFKRLGVNQHAIAKKLGFSLTHTRNLMMGIVPNSEKMAELEDLFRKSTEEARRARNNR